MLTYSLWMLSSAIFSLIVFVPLLEGNVQNDRLNLFRYTVNDNDKTEFAVTVVSNETIVLEKHRSPFLVKQDIFVAEDGELIIEPGVTVLFAPTVGITVRGILTAKGESNDRIVFTSSAADRQNAGSRLQETWQRVRLTDGPNIHTGRLQIYHNDQWRSVCTNSRNWTKSDLETVCRQMGFQGGRFWKWMDRETGISRSHLLLEKPSCQQTFSSIYHCNWATRQMGSGVCDYHPDIGIECSPCLDKEVAANHWRGIHFQKAKHQRTLIHHNTLYIEKSLSKLTHADISYAGAGRDYGITAALQVEGVSPTINSCIITFSAYNGLNVTDPQAPVTLVNTTFSNNRGYGVYVNTTEGGTLIDSCTVEQNGADGIKFVHHEETYRAPDRTLSSLDFCTFPTASYQVFPVIVNIEQSISSSLSKECHKNFFTRSGQVLTVFLQQLKKSENGNATIEIYDGFSASENLLSIVNILNNTRPQSVTTTSNNLYIKFNADARTEVSAVIKIVSSFGKWYDLNVSDSVVNDNNGRGVAVENIQSQFLLKRTSVSNNKHVAGVHVLYGAAYVNISESRISFNHGDGLNVSYAGGVRNISDSFISSNKGFGVAVWLNLTTRRETFLREYWQEDVDYVYVPYNQETVVAYNEIFRNLDSGIMVGNFCGNALVNISGNWFNNSVGHCIEIQSCWKGERERSKNLMTVQIGNNYFVENKKLGIKITPLVNAETVIEYNWFTKHTYGGILIRNGLNKLLNRLYSKVTIRNNEFYDNSGAYVVNIGLSPYSETQKLSFTWNFVKHNRIQEPFQSKTGTIKLKPRSQVAAPIVISSENTNIYRNIIENHESQYEIGSHLEDQSLVINCTYNWLGHSGEDKLVYRIFHRKDRYDLAKIDYIPYLLHNTNPASNVLRDSPTYVSQFLNPSTKMIGGEVDGFETLRAAEYFVERDVNIRPGGKLTLEAGVTLRFPPGIGMMVAGKLEARGRSTSEIKFTLIEDRSDAVLEYNNETEIENPLLVDMPPVKLVGGRTPMEGRLQVNINGRWGTVCNYGWTIESAALVCHQLGYVLNPNDWLMEYHDVPQAGISDPILLSNVRCMEEDLDVTKCKAESESEFENSCNHDHDVGMRCHEAKWAGVRFGVLAERTSLQYLLIEQAGLLDYATNQLKPALQIDLNRHILENIRLNDNIEDGLGIIYSDLYSLGMSNIVKNCEFKNNEGSGVSIKQFGLKITGSVLMKNKIAGIRHDPTISVKQQQEIAGWFKLSSSDYNAAVTYSPILLPRFYENSVIDFSNEGDTKYIITERLHNSQQVNKTYLIKAKAHLVLGIQVLNPIHNESTEQITIYDGYGVLNLARMWNLRKDLMSFPILSKSNGITLKYESGSNAMGNVILIITSTTSRQETRYSRAMNFDSFPTLLVTNSHIKENGYGIWSSYYNSYVSEFGDHYLRKSNETLCIIDCDISFNNQEVLLVQSFNSMVLDQSNISETTIIINDTKITDNNRGIRQFSRDQHNSNNLFHWFMYKNVIERNSGGSFEVALPYVWSYNENYTHSVVLENNTWKFNKLFAFIVDGHYAQLNMTGNVFQNNNCKHGLISIRGMEKSMKITRNVISDNEGVFMVEFKASSQSEIRGELRALFFENSLKRNNPPSPETPSSLIVFDGIQRVRIKRNLLSDNGLAYSLVAGVKTAQVDSRLDISENWWGTVDHSKIKRQIFDFDDWNDHALANFRPFLIEDDFDSSVSVSFDPFLKVDVDNLSGRLVESLILPKRDQPYIIRSDLTVMPDVTLTIEHGVTLEFAPRVGLLVLGTLIAKGWPDDKILMKPLSQKHYSSAKLKKPAMPKNSVRLCIENNCTDPGRKTMNEGFLEYWNTTTLQWVPLCDETFVEQNARVVCRQLGLGSLNAWVSRGRRYEFLPNALSRIWSWPEPWQCSGEEELLDDCPERLQEQWPREKRMCNWDSMFVFIHCGDVDSTEENVDYWGGIRLSNGEFEWNNFKDRIHDPVTHDSVRYHESIIENVEIIGAGMLHYHKSPALLAIFKSPVITKVNVTQSASQGINLISPGHDVKLLFNRVEKCLGSAISISSLTGEGRENSESSFIPAQKIDIPYNAFGMLDMCDPMKEIFLQERILLYYKYTNSPVSCIKIFHSNYRIKSFGIRFLQLNLFNESDTLSLYDGSIYNVSSPVITIISSQSQVKRQFLTTNGTSLSVKMMVSGAAQVYGFIAEVVTLPISGITFNRDILHNVSYSVIKDNWAGGLFYVSVGEVNPRFTMEWNQIVNNCVALWGNFTSCDSAVTMDLQNTQNLHFRNNLVRNNIGGLWIKADSVGSATSLKAVINNNLFADNRVKSALKIEGRRSSPYQDVVLYRNYFAKNFNRFENVIVLSQVMSNFTINFVQDNVGSHILEVSGFDGVRLPIFQTTSHNSFYWNVALERDSRSTIMAGTAGQHYIDNIFSNPDNDYEIMTVNTSFIHMWKTSIDARYNYWGYNETYAVGGRIHDHQDDFRLMEVDFQPYHMVNDSLLDDKCPPAWNLVGDTCYIYIGAPMSFYEAREFCSSVNASMPYVTTSYVMLYKFVKMQQEYYMFYDRVWVQNINRINKCTTFVHQNTEEYECDYPLPFICEMDPKVSINVLSWTNDVLTIAVFSSIILLFLLLALVVALWYSKSKRRQTERLQRRNSIRQSLNSLRSLSSSQTAFSELGYKRKAMTQSQNTNLSLSRSSDYKKMNGSLDSMDKSQFNSSLEEDAQSFDIYEAHNPNAATVSADRGKNNYIDLAYQNQGYRTNSSFTSRDDDTWRSSSYANECSTLPLTNTLQLGDSTATVSSRQDYQRENEYQEYYERAKSSNTILETDFDVKPEIPSVPPTRSKSETLLETNFDYMLPSQDVKYSTPVRELLSASSSRSKSQPLETAM